MKSLLYFVSSFGLASTTYHQHATHGLNTATHGLNTGCGEAVCGLASGVAIPNFRSYRSPSTPMFQRFGLIEVQVPHTRPYAVPSFIASTPKFAVATPQRGKVVEKTEPSYFCKKSGFVLEGVDCVQTLFENPRTVCPLGFDLNGEQACVKKASILQTCPASYLRRDGGCVKATAATFLEVCPEGTIQTGSYCQKQVPIPLTPTCESGAYDTRTGSCSVSAFVDARAYCPEAFNFDEVDGVCLQEEVYDCSNQPLGIQTIPQLGITQVAPVTQLGHHGWKGRHLLPVEEKEASSIEASSIEGEDNTVAGEKRLLTHVNHGGIGPIGVQSTAVTQLHPHLAPLSLAPLSLAPPATPCVHTAPPPCEVPCVAQRVAPPPCEAPPPTTLVQPTKTTISVQKTCTRVTSTALVFACDEGTLQQNRCLVRQAVPPVPVCKGQGGVEYCHNLQRVPPLKVCPEGYTQECATGRVCQCLAYQSAAFALSCPAGFETSGDGCQRASAAQTICPPGYVIQDGSCVRVIREPADCVFSVTYACDRSLNSECAA